MHTCIHAHHAESGGIFFKIGHPDLPSKESKEIINKYPALSLHWLDTCLPFLPKIYRVVIQ